MCLFITKFIYVQNGHKATVQTNEMRFAIKHFYNKAHFEILEKNAPHFLVGWSRELLKYFTV